MSITLSEVFAKNTARFSALPLLKVSTMAYLQSLMHRIAAVSALSSTMNPFCFGVAVADMVCARDRLEITDVKQARW